MEPALARGIEHCSTTQRHPGEIVGGLFVKEKVEASVGPTQRFEESDAQDGVAEIVVLPRRTNEDILH